MYDRGFPSEGSQKSPRQGGTNQYQYGSKKKLKNHKGLSRSKSRNCQAYLSERIVKPAYSREQLQISDRKMDFSDLQPSACEEAPDQAQVIIGYYNLRGKAQVCRLICQYLKVNYRDHFLSLKDWDSLKKGAARTWPFADLPFLQEGNFIVTEAIPICQYLIDRFGDRSLLGRNQRDIGIVAMYLWTIEVMTNVITINCQRKYPEELENQKREQWKNNVGIRLNEYENAAVDPVGNWYLGYLTLIDFSIYQLMRYMRLLYPEQMTNYVKLLAIEQKIGELAAIYEYERSQRCVRETDPTKLLEELRKKTTHTA